MRSVRYLPTSYGACEKFYKGKTRTGKIAHNTWVIDASDTPGEMAYGIVYHRTRIVKFSVDERAVLNTGGWRTSTTKARLNACGFNVWQEVGNWYLTVRDITYDFVDGIEILSDGTVLAPDNSGPAIWADVAKDRREYNRQRRAIRAASRANNPNVLYNTVRARAQRSVESHNEKKARLDRSIGTVLAEYSNKLPTYAPR